MNKNQIEPNEKKNLKLKSLLNSLKSKMERRKDMNLKTIYFSL